jgi:hypothetical protein
MTQEQINKLQELKKLLEAGILTEEEMLAEKAKVLDASNTQSSSETATKPDVVNSTASKEAIVQGTSANALDGTVNETDRNKTEGGQKAIANRKYIILAAVALLVIGLIIYAASSSNSPKVTYADTEEIDVTDMNDTEPLNEEEPAKAEAEETLSSTEDEFGLDPWSGSLNIEGDIYRMCSTLAYITLSKTGKGMYSGTMELMLGDKDIDLDTHEPTGRFFDDQGHLTGKIRAKADGQTLTIVLDSYTIGKPSEFFDDLSKSQQIFRLTYDGQSYSAQAVGKMQTFFDSIEIK